MDIKKRTLAFSCDQNIIYDDNIILSNPPLPWIVKILFKVDNEFQGEICSGLMTKMVYFQILINIFPLSNNN